MTSVMRFRLDFRFKLSLDFFPNHAQVDIKKNKVTPYMEQFFKLLNFGKDCVVKQGNQFFIQLTQEEYFMFIFLHCLSRYGIKTEVIFFIFLSKIFSKIFLNKYLVILQREI